MNKLCYIFFGDIMEALSNKQSEILTFIKKFMIKNGRSPSVREIASGVRLNSPATVHVHINHLIDKGYLKRNDINKLLELMVPNEFEIHEDSAIKVPYIDKMIFKNYEYDFDNPDDFFYLSSQMIPKGSEVFVFNIPDNSVADYGLIKNDDVIVEKERYFTTGDLIVLFHSDEGFVIKKFTKSINLKYYTVLGKIIGLYRKL